MSITVTHVWTDRNSLVYLLTNSGSPLGGTTSIIGAGAATPDLVTDAASTSYAQAASGALRRVVRAGLDGIGTIAAGALVQAGARNLLFGDGTAGIGNGETTPKARVRLGVRSGTATWTIDGNVDGSGNPQIDIGSSAAAGVAMLYVELDHSLAK